MHWLGLPLPRVPLVRGLARSRPARARERCDVRRTARAARPSAPARRARACARACSRTRIERGGLTLYYYSLHYIYIYIYIWID